MFKSRRFCLNCGKITTFKCKGKKTGYHSVCAECGGTRATLPLKKKKKMIKKMGIENYVRRVEKKKVFPDFDSIAYTKYCEDILKNE